MINDFTAKLQWRGMMVNSKVHECGKFFIEGDASGAPYCFARKADNSGSFFLGEDYKVRAVCIFHSRDLVSCAPRQCHRRFQSATVCPALVEKFSCSGCELDCAPRLFSHHRYL